jgi:hypothetical protein
MARVGLDIEAIPKVAMMDDKDKEAVEFFWKPPKEM